MREFLFLVMVLITIGCGNVPDRIYANANDLPTETVVKSLNGIDTVHVEFEHDILTFVPAADGYIIYSEVSEDAHCIDHLYTGSAQSFLWWVIQFPYDSTDHSDTMVELGANGYYRELITEKIYE
mgnify:CR=1 FL=1